MEIPRSYRFETLADFGNGCKLESYYPEEDGYSRYPLIYVRQGASAAPLKLDQLEALRDALAELIADNIPPDQEVNP